MPANRSGNSGSCWRTSQCRWRCNTIVRTIADDPRRPAGPAVQRSMDAQRSHLMMGLISGETNRAIPQCSFAPGSVRARISRRLLPARRSQSLGSFAIPGNRDFAGGRTGSRRTGSANGQPSAAYIADHRHDQWLWPHILRKTRLIEDMLHARAPVMAPFVVPSPYDLLHGQQPRMALLAKPAREGVIVGRIGNHWPSLYVNAVSYRGLLAGAEFAERLGKHRQAAAWKDQARILLETWQRRNVNGHAHLDESPMQQAAFSVFSSQPVGAAASR